MKSFRTEIVETKDLSILMKLLTTGFFMVANYLWVINAFEEHWGLKYVFGGFFFMGTLLFLSIPFLKPDKIGRLKVSSEGIDFSCKENEVRVTLPQIKQVELKCEGFKRWRNRAAHGNRNYLILETIDDNCFEFEILVKSREDKNVLAGMLAAQKDNQSFSSIGCEEEIYAG